MICLNQSFTLLILYYSLTEICSKNENKTVRFISIQMSIKVPNLLVVRLDALTNTLVLQAVEQVLSHAFIVPKTQEWIVSLCQICCSSNGKF